MDERMMRRAGQWVLAMVCAAGLAACGGASTNDAPNGEQRDIAETPDHAQQELDGIPMNLATLLDRRVERIVLPDDASEHERVLVEFIEFMREGDLETAMMLVDPSSPGYEDLERGLAAIAVGIERYDAETGIPVDDFLRMMFTIAYDSCRYELVYSDEAGQAVQYRLTFDDAQPVLFQTEEGEIIRYIPGRPAAAEITVTIHSVDGEWMIYPEPHPDGLIRPVGLMREGATTQ